MSLYVGSVHCRPAYGGRDCPGSAFDYQMCSTEDCPGPYEDFRAQQCVQRSNKYHQNMKHTWLPYEHPHGERWCRLSHVDADFLQDRKWGELVFPYSMWGTAFLQSEVITQGGVGAAFRPCGEITGLWGWASGAPLCP